MSRAEMFLDELRRTDVGCHEYTWATDPKGYGRLRVNGKMTLAHRFAWQLANGPIPPGMNVLHHCDNPPCCETEPSEEYPEGHLFLGTILDNNADMAAKGRSHNQNDRKTHCGQGHPFNEANTYVVPSGAGRMCRACQSDLAPAKNVARRAAHKTARRSIA